MRCQYCGNELPDGQAFCGNCGAPVQNAPVQPEPVNNVNEYPQQNGFAQPVNNANDFAQQGGFAQPVNQAPYGTAPVQQQYNDPNQGAYQSSMPYSNQVNYMPNVPAPAPVKTPIYKKWWFWLIIVLIIIGIVIALVLIYAIIAHKKRQGRFLFLNLF